jgi:hypothetical protein
MAFDFNQAGEQRSFDVIPDKTVVVAQLNIRPGGAGEGGILRRSKTGEAEMLDCELVVVGGPYDKRKFWENLVLAGTTDGHATAIDISVRKLKAIVESARGIKPTDVSEAAKKARAGEYHELDGIRFIVRVGVEPAKDNYRAKNTIDFVITPDMKEWHPVEQVAKPAKPTSGSSGGGNVIVKPPWAQ